MFALLIYVRRLFKRSIAEFSREPERLLVGHDDFLREVVPRGKLRKTLKNYGVFSGKIASSRRHAL